MFTTVTQNIKFAECYVAKKKDAMRRGIEFTLSFQAFVNMKMQTQCAYTGLPFSETVEEDKMTMERIDNDKGYINGNVVPVMKRYNSLRNQLTSKTIDLEIVYREDKATAMEDQLQDVNVLILNLEHQLYDLKDDVIDETKLKQVLVEKCVVPAKKQPHLIKALNTLHGVQLKIDERQANLDRAKMLYADPKASEATRQHWKAAIPKIEDKVKSQVKIYNAQKTALIKFTKNMRVYMSVQHATSEQRERIEIMASLRENKELATQLTQAIIRQREIIKELKVIKPALIKFENLSPKDKVKVEYGLPLSTSTLNLLKHKLGYSLLVNHM